MVSLRPFTSFLFGLIVPISLHSFAFSQKDMEEKQVLIAAANTFTLLGRSSLTLSKEIDAVPTRGEGRIEEIDGRKMMKMKVLKKEQGINIVNETSKISGANSDNFNLKRSKQQNIDFNLSDRSNSISVPHGRMRMKVRMDDSVSLNADYKAPKSHPPKNN